MQEFAPYFGLLQNTGSLINADVSGPDIFIRFINTPCFHLEENFPNHTPGNTLGSNKSLIISLAGQTDGNIR